MDFQRKFIKTEFAECHEFNFRFQREGGREEKERKRH
jgi:hypothetical protein